MTAGALALAWFLSAVFERSFTVIALILLAMLVVTLIRRMVEGGIPDESHSDRNPETDRSDDGSGRPDIQEETRHLPGVDHSYDWMTPSPVDAFVGVTVSLLV